MSCRTRVKVCGLTRREDVRLCCELGADAVGFVLVSKSPRYLSLRRAAELARETHGLTQSVALLMNPSTAEVSQVIADVRPSMLQFHGSESGAFCDQFEYPYLKAISHHHAGSTLDAYTHAQAFIIDSHQPGQPGGSGKTFDWQTIPGTIDRPWLLAGGIGPHNVADAIAAVGPYGVDMASAVESEPGIKDADLLKKLFDEVRRADGGSR